MKRILSKVFLGALLAVSAGQFAVTSCHADEYWDGHWRWYDNSYRPYYQRRYYYSDPYATQYRYYGPSPYYGGYYYAPRPYYAYPPGGGVQVGPLRFGWW